MLRYPKPTTTTSTEMIDRTEKFFVKQIPAILLRKYSLTPLQEVVLHELHYQCYMKATEENPLETSFKELAAFMNRAEHSITDAVKHLADLGIISLTISKGKGITGIKIYFLIDPLKETDAYLSPLVKSLQKKAIRLEEIEEPSKKRTKKDNPEPEISEPKETKKTSIPSPPPSSSLEEKNETLKSQFPGFSGF